MPKLQKFRNHTNILSSVSNCSCPAPNFKSTKIGFESARLCIFHNRVCDLPPGPEMRIVCVVCCVLKNIYWKNSGHSFGHEIKALSGSDKKYWRPDKSSTTLVDSLLIELYHDTSKFISLIFLSSLKIKKITRWRSKTGVWQPWELLKFYI